MKGKVAFVLIAIAALVLLAYCTIALGAQLREVHP
jgi:hypothetical protein